MREKRRAWFQFRLRSLFALTVAVCLFLGVRYHVGFGQRAARKTVEGHGGYLICDGMASEWTGTSRCLSFIIGRDCFSGRVTVAIPNATLTKNEVRRLCMTPQLDTLDLTGSSFPPGSWVYLSEALRLDTLVLSSTNFDDTAVQHLLDLQELTRLELSDTRITDTTLAKLRELPNLKKLVIDRTNITDAGLLMLGNYPQLREVSVLGTPTTEDAVGSLRTCAPSIVVDWSPSSTAQ